ncbi:hypothetical protein [Pseudomonas sp. HY2-MNA-CIBAN-0224]|uniref:hypothetical protein n=1 Tax=Pseudomonas sp. HY2-MNA-CIBAN-0224 TaxID=3140471 RepID=UPI003317D565
MKKEFPLPVISEVEDDEECFWRLPPDQLKSIKLNLDERCKAAKIDFKVEYDDDGDGEYIFALNSGREKRVVSFWDQNDLALFAQIDFEKYIYLSGLQAICNYEDGTIEAMVETASGGRPNPILYKKFFGVSVRDARKHGAKLSVETDVGSPAVELGIPTDEFKVLVGYGIPSITIKISNLNIRQHDEALKYLMTIASSLLFQLDMVSDTPLVVKKVGLARKKTSKLDKLPVLVFPKIEFDSAPLSLYWYGRSAVGMPLLQYLAFYQVIEFYFPRYSQSEAHRKLKSLLKDPTFRSEKDSDVAKLLDAIHVSKSGAFGDERSQLRAVLDECTYSDEIRAFITSDSERLAFFNAKSKGAYHKINTNSEDVDLRVDVSRRIYEIRCKIVHTKSDSRDVEVKMLLPFSAEADQLRFDIELIQYVAQRVLIAGGTQLGKL